MGWDGKRWWFLFGIWCCSWSGSWSCTRILLPPVVANRALLRYRLFCSVLFCHFLPFVHSFIHSFIHYIARYLPPRLRLARKYNAVQYNIIHL